MTLPFRRRHHDDEASHDRARALISAALDAPLEPGDDAWLADHLSRCPECTFDAQAYRDDRALLQALRDNPPVPPRDLWARTAAAIEQESRRGRAGQPMVSRLGTLVPRRQRLPLGVLSGALVVLVVVAVAFVPSGPITPPSASGGSSPVAIATLPPNPTQIAIPNADSVAWIERNPDGSYDLVQAPVSAACPTGDSGCAPLPAGSPTPLQLGASPQAVVLSPNSDQVAVVGSSGSTAGTVVIVAVPTPRPSGASSPSPATATPTVAPPTQPPATPHPSSSALTSSAEPSAEPVPGGHAIISGVQVIGDTDYSASGDWLAFSARPIDSTSGPYLYAWHVGDDQATQLTSAGSETYFAGWYGDEIVASQVERAEVAGPSGSPSVVGVPRSFLLDPATGVRKAFRADEAWLPSIDQHGRFVTYWSGNLAPVYATAGPGASGAASAAPSEALATTQPSDGSSETPLPSPSATPQPIVGWQLGDGRLVLDGWSDALAPSPSTQSSGASATEVAATQETAPSTAPTSAASAEAGASGAPSASPELLAEGPAGTAIELASGSLASFDARFDPDGTRLAIWVSDSGDPTVGRLWLVLLDPTTGSIRSDSQPLPAPGVTALHGFSLLSGRLGWVTPPGQDGQLSSVHILAWSGDDFGEVQTVPGGNLQIVR